MTDPKQTQTHQHAGSQFNLDPVHMDSSKVPFALENSHKTHVYWAFKFDTKSIIELIIILTVTLWTICLWRVRNNNLNCVSLRVLTCALLSCFWLYLGYDVYTEHETWSSYPCIHYHNSIQVPGPLPAGLVWFLTISATILVYGSTPGIYSFS